MSDRKEAEGVHRGQLLDPRWLETKMSRAFIHQQFKTHECCVPFVLAIVPFEHAYVFRLQGLAQIIVTDSQLLNRTTVRCTVRQEKELSCACQSFE